MNFFFLDSVQSIHILSNSLMHCEDEVVLEKFVDLLEVSMKMLEMDIQAIQNSQNAQVSEVSANYHHLLHQCQLDGFHDFHDLDEPEGSFFNEQHKMEVLQLEHDYLWGEVMQKIHEMEYAVFKGALDLLIEDDNSAQDTEEDTDDQPLALLYNFYDEVFP